MFERSALLSMACEVGVVWEFEPFWEIDPDVISDNDVIGDFRDSPDGDDSSIGLSMRSAAGERGDLGSTLTCSSSP